MRKTVRPLVRRLLGRKPLYPWDDWFSRDETFTLTKGTDYKCQTLTFMQQIRSRATGRGLKVSISMKSEFVITVSVKRF